MFGEGVAFDAEFGALHDQAAFGEFRGGAGFGRMNVILGVFESLEGVFFFGILDLCIPSINENKLLKPRFTKATLLFFVSKVHLLKADCLDN